MNVCESHDCVVVHKNRSDACPICELQKERDELEEEKKQLADENDTLEGTKEELEEEIEELRGKLEELQRQFLIKELNNLEGESDGSR